MQSAAPNADRQKWGAAVTAPHGAFRLVGIVRTFESRDDISKIMTGKAVEIGTYNGDFAAGNLNNFKGEYYMVDTNVRKELQARLDSWVNEKHIHFFKNEIDRSCSYLRRQVVGLGVH